jgi:predicted RNA-binding protein with PUA-like domain
VTRRYWLMKTEPTTFSFDDLWRAPKRTTSWDGVRNFKARNYMRDDMHPGDGVFVYHSSTEVPAVIGIADVVKGGHPDPTAFDRTDPHYDPKSNREAPTWMMVDIRATERFAHPVPLAELRETKGLAGMSLLKKGNRLSVQPVTAAEWEIICRLGRGGATRARTP